MENIDKVFEVTIFHVEHAEELLEINGVKIIMIEGFLFEVDDIRDFIFCKISRNGLHEVASYPKRLYYN